MRSLYYLLQKEFRLIFRNPAILRLIIAMPLVQLILIPFAADYEVRNIRFSVVDDDHSTYARQLIQKMDASGYFKLVDIVQDQKAALDKVGRGATDLIMTIPRGFEKDVVAGNGGTLFLAADAVNGMKAGMGMSYSRQIIADFNQEIRSEWIPVMPRGTLPLIEVQSSAWYNPHSNYHWFMVPGILAILVTMVGSFLTALNIVAEKESGTIEQLNVTPVSKIHFILGKLVPFWLLGIVSITISMGVGWLIYGLWPVGSVLAILIYAAIYLLAVLGIGLFISTVADNQQQATLIAFFFMMIFILMGGLYTPVESMPDWAQWISRCNPPMYFIRGIRAIYLMGSSLWDLRWDVFITFGFAVFFNGLAVWNYRKAAR
ncbi:MAG TPA: ABC transporter permease [Saprospiraceae bacterium]|nr:ABC transporter permease [Saprospiraceae bacterium]